MALTWLHLSDLHFRASSSSAWERDLVHEALRRDVLDQLRAGGLKPDLIFVTGDIAFGGNPDEYEQAKRFFAEVAQTTETDPATSWFVVPGNHDVDRASVRKQARRLLGTVHDPEDAHEILTDADTLRAFTARQQGFFRFTQDFLGPARAWTEGAPWKVERAQVSGHSLAILGLNSAWTSEGGDEDQGRILLGEYQVRCALKEADQAQPDLKIALLHHPLDWLRSFDQEKAAQLLFGAGGAHFLLRGHLHRGRIARQINPDAHCIELASGACWQDATYPHGVTLVRLDPEAGKGRVHMWRYTPEGRGFWAPDNFLYESLKGGVWDFAIPESWNLRVHPASPTPAADAGLGRVDVAWDRASYRAGTDICRVLVRVQLDERKFREDAEKAPSRTRVHHVLVLDVSGSMNEPRKYPVLKQAVHAYLSFVAPEDLVTLIPFSSESAVLWQSVPVADVARFGGRADVILDAWPHRFGGTYLNPALLAAMDTIRAARETGFSGVERLHCLTDGHLGDRRDCQWTIRGVQGEGIEVNLFGFGEDFDASGAEDLLSSLAAGVVRYAPTTDNQLVDYFGHVARTSQRVVTRDARLTLSVAPDVTCFHAFTCRPHERHLGDYSNVIAPTIVHSFGMLEYRKTYELLFELRAWQPQEQIGRIVFEATTTRGRVVMELPLKPAFGAHSATPDPLVETVANAVRALVSNDRETQIAALDARIRLFKTEGRAPQHIASLERQLEMLRGGGQINDLSQDDLNFAKADAATATVTM
jgi:Mg-chelatase subunit ChlD/predicted MPP superfamily phosphohydrolase